MKVAIAYVASFVCYWLGHGISLVMNNAVGAYLYPVYCRLMCWSGDVEEWAGIEYKWVLPDSVTNVMWDRW